MLAQGANELALGSSTMLRPHLVEKEKESRKVGSTFISDNLVMPEGTILLAEAIHYSGSLSSVGHHVLPWHYLSFQHWALLSKNG